MSCLHKKLLKDFKTNFLSVSVLRTFITCSDCFTTKVFHSLNLANISFLALSTYTQILHEKLLMKMRKYLAFPMGIVHIGPHTSERTSSKIFVVWSLHPSRMVALLVCLRHTLHMQTNTNRLAPCPHPSRSSCFEAFLQSLC